MDSTIDQAQGAGRIKLISFVVPAWNEEDLLESCLSSIRKAAESVDVPHEIVVANDGSTDRTGEIADRLADRTVNVTNRKISATRNAGARAAHGDLLVFVDADTVISKDVVPALIQAVREGAIGGGCRVQFDGPVPFWHRGGPMFFNAVQRRFLIAFGCFLFCTRAAFDAVGGFDESLYITEEITMSRVLHGVGRFVVLPQHVVTSGRKLHAHSPWELFVLMTRAILYGPRFFRKPEGKAVWYGERKPPRSRFRSKGRE